MIDGEHYAPVVRDALRSLPHEVAAAVLVGGTEKLRGGEDYGVPLAATFEDALALYEPDLVYDLSDEPVLGPPERFALASAALAHGIPYAGPDFRFDPPALAPFALPSLGIVGTGKRVGKTAVSIHAARLLAEEREVVVVAMGRGGPPDPEVADVPPVLENLLALARRGRHAASDYLEDAALARVVTVGCRRCGGGLAGTTGVSNVLAGADVAAARDPDLVVFEGSGAAFPPVATDRRILVVSARQPSDLVTGYLNRYRVLVSDLIVVTMAEDERRSQALVSELASVNPAATVVATVLRPRPVDDVSGRRVAFFSAAPDDALPVLVRHLEEEHGAEVVHASGHLAERDVLRRELARLDADAYLIEIKAAAIEIVAEAATARGVDVVFADNVVVPLPGQPSLDDELRRLAAAAAGRVQHSTVR